MEAIPQQPFSLLKISIQSTKLSLNFFPSKGSFEGAILRSCKGQIGVKCQTMILEVLRSMEDMIANGNDHEMLKRSAPAASKGDWRKYLTSRAMLL